MAKIMKIRCTLIEDMLGSNPNTSELFSEYIASKAPDAQTREEEIELYGEDSVTERGTTVFRYVDGKPCYMGYQVRGFLKSALGYQNKFNPASKVTAHKKAVDLGIFVAETIFPIHTDAQISICQRPLRAQTAQGERIAIASSESVPAGSWMEFSVGILEDKLVAPVKTAFQYGRLNGMGQWRNSGKGRFEAEIIEEKDAEPSDVIGMIVPERECVKRIREGKM